MPPLRRQRRPDSWAGIARGLEELRDEELMRGYRSLDGAIEAGGDPAGRAARLDQLAAEALRRNPTSTALWSDRGRFAKWRRDWPVSRDFNLRAVELIPPERREGEPAVWDLGVAATALRDWRTARTAWSAFGLPLVEDLDEPDPQEPIEVDLGPACVRLNPEPRFVGERPLTVDGRRWAVEVVRGHRICPARIRIVGVPAPASGHRFGDVVLHDGERVGTRRPGGRDLEVFDELALWRRSPLPTLTTTVLAPDQQAVRGLADLVAGAGGAVEDWTATCPSGDWLPARRLGLAGDPDDVRGWLARWTAGGAGRSGTGVEIALR